MPLPDRQQVHQQKLKQFRKVFLQSIADGTYPSERQRLLYQSCKDTGLDWDEARRFVRPEAEAFFARAVSKATSAEEIQSLQRRLGLDKPAQSSLSVQQPVKTPWFSPALRKRLASVVTALVMAYIGMRVLDRVFIVMWAWVVIPWWGPVVMAVFLFFAVDYLVGRIIR